MTNLKAPLAFQNEEQESGKLPEDKFIHPQDPLTNGGR